MLRSFSATERRALRLLLIVTVITRLALAFRPDWQVCTRPFNDDSFYIFTVSHHLALGDGISVDGIHPTNGIQPLVTFLYVPFFLIADKLIAVRLCFILIALCDCLSIIFLAKLLQRLTRSNTEGESSIWLRPPIIVAALWALLYPIIIHTANGLETAVYSTLLIICSYVYVKLRHTANTPTVLSWLGFGALLGVTVLARIDAAILVAAFVVVELLRYKSNGVTSSLIFGSIAVLVSSPWWIYNYLTFGSIMPQSGYAESLENLLGENLRRGAIVIGDIFSTFFFLPNYDLPAWFHFFWMATLGGIVIWLIKRYNLNESVKERFDLSGLLPLALASIGIIIYYVFFFGAPHFLPRYFQPARILWLVVFSCAAPILIQRFREFAITKRTLARSVLIICFVAIAAFNIPRYIYYFVISTPSELYLTGKWAEERPSKLVGMEQTGTAAFLSSNVVNLDGKVNFEALKAKQRGDIGSYIVERDLDYIVDWREFSTAMVASAERHGVNFRLVDSLGRVIIFERVRK